MLPGFRARFIALFVMVLALGIAAPIHAASPVSTTSFDLLDLEDSDGDGIPNHLDPDDDNDGVTDEDENEDTEPNPDTDNTAKPDDTGAANPGTGTTAPTDAGPPANAPAAQVTTLPNTGAGVGSISSSGLGALLLVMSAFVMTFFPLIRTSRQS